MSPVQSLDRAISQEYWYRTSFSLLFILVHIRNEIHSYFSSQGTDYTFANTSAIQILIDSGMNIFRVPFLMERMVPTSLTGTLDSAYFQGYSEVHIPPPFFLLGIMLIR